MKKVLLAIAKLFNINLTHVITETVVVERVKYIAENDTIKGNVKIEGDLYVAGKLFVSGEIVCEKSNVIKK